MTTTAPTFTQIKAQVVAIRRKIPDARVIGIRSDGRWTGECRKQDGEETYEIVQCDSPLAMRLALRGNIDHKTTKVLMTGLTDKDLSDDILLRLTKRRLFPLDSWEIVKALFQAHVIDPRVMHHRWVAEFLMDWIPAEGYPPMSSGFLDAETVWAIVLHRGMGLTTEHPDLQAVLRWSTDEDNVHRYRAAPSAFREAAAAWLSELAGPAVAVVLDCVVRNDRPDALPVGLAAGVLFHPSTAGRLEKAIGKLEERYLGGVSPHESTIGRWSAAASEVVRLQLTDLKHKRPQLQRADEILGEVGAEPFAYLSDTSPRGFDLRLAGFGERVLETLKSLKPQASELLTRVRHSVLEHDRATSERRRLERLDMAVRLVRWLTETRKRPAQPQSLAEAITYHLSEGGFIDWARLMLGSDDPVRELSAAYAKLFEQVTALREEHACRFALLLKDWTAAGSTGDMIIPIERILELLVAPLASQAPVLIVVVDGMSMSVCRELVADVTRQDWVTLCQEGQESSVMAGVATIPSITETSRTSLLCGQLRQGTADDEKAGFAAHAALLVYCRSGAPPVVFHKPSLREENDTVLASEVRQAIASPHRRIVGVVVNAVDDHLLKGDQIDTRWTRDEIKILPTLFYEAKLARRVVVLLSDHGHVLDHKTEGKLCEGGERWRFDTGEPQQTELRISGSRVVLPDSHTLIAPWTERLRYGAKKNGYHGGLTPQEMVVPIVVLCAHDKPPQGWVEAPVDTPVWWDEPLREEEPRDQAPPTVQPITKSQDLGPLFNVAQREEQEAVKLEVVESPPDEFLPAWVKALLASPTFREQKKLAGRAVPADKIFAQLLTALDRRGGKLTATALARAIEYPPLRLPGLLAVLQRIMNIDGYAVLTRDDMSDTIELNTQLLCQQFDLGEKETIAVE